ncbi:unnamed protein product [Rangifer tarandus platyrhynchus]|uniref:Uncharacterized protein n=2 Tax=Rangifer tarandus platyrhynchus TaxID=3082113 RepID=A0ABN8XT56_RANTA|nr:unnamed protein product [Rangifer tarandus platyrhynchus]CAI9691410.1 unnamed protein product [Rangifer tarandus platyrhynchus]
MHFSQVGSRGLCGGGRWPPGGARLVPGLRRVRRARCTGAPGLWTEGAGRGGDSAELCFQDHTLLRPEKRRDIFLSRLSQSGMRR